MEVSITEKKKQEYAKLLHKLDEELAEAYSFYYKNYYHPSLKVKLKCLLDPERKEFYKKALDNITEIHALLKYVKSTGVV